MAPRPAAAHRPQVMMMMMMMSMMLMMMMILITVLSSGPYMFSSSRRLALLHDEGSPDYNLQISEVRHEDGGEYRCQLNTRPAQVNTGL